MLNKVLVIDEKEYFVSLHCNHENLDYYFLINVDDKNDFKYCYQKGDKLMEILDANEIFKVAQIFSKQIIDN